MLIRNTAANDNIRMKNSRSWCITFFVLPHVTTLYCMWLIAIICNVSEKAFYFALQYSKPSGTMQATWYENSRLWEKHRFCWVTDI